ncbi:tripartite tricarboxylate transporter substrate binding protein [Allopusillimonas soli]|uniref:Tripartite tricarboxylate transporter substrate binding protein n=1 Tax=Allopusillimonas soli TaxID=659016 RepID=A0A853F8P8_9BURK|nr:tripartite tricarboxylate transporter substrate binding protein [Allopusillimonas soli]NYT37025.1 tripartite tricarboxylate transporter substrate binding protein [Allopusillimonas soli]TEA75469.1 tripartite tricarboxylate transporter substrate binding protein [Allopusillimonas soli]
MKRGIIVCALASFLALCAAPALADGWPAKPIRLIVPFGPGGTTDLLARLVADGLSRQLGQSVVVENKPGAGGNIGAAEVARATPDGYTMLMGTPGPLAINPYIYPEMSFDPAKDFAAVSHVADVPNVILGYPGSGLKNMRDVLEEAKAHPGKLNWGSPGVGSTGHIALELLKQLSGVDITHVPYKGAAQATTDLIAGNIQLAADNVPTALANIRAGKVVALGVASKQRLDVLPDVEPVADTVKGYALSSWFVIVAPAGTPDDIIARLAREIDAFEQKPEIKDKFKALGAMPVGGTPAQLAAHLDSERKRFGGILENLRAAK